MVKSILPLFGLICFRNMPFQQASKILNLHLNFRNVRISTRSTYHFTRGSYSFWLELIVDEIIHFVIHQISQTYLK